MDLEKLVGLSETIARRVLVVVAFLGMLLVNGLANSIPIAGVTTQEVSQKYMNLFTPAGYTFIIWGLIYLLLGIYSLYQLLSFRQELQGEKKEVFDRVRLYFILSSIANALWIFAWHYEKIGASLLLMLVILVSLILINGLLEGISLTGIEKIAVALPFSVYFGWITIATIANVAAFLVSIGFSGLGISEATWTVITLLIGLLIGGITTWKNKDIAYGLTIIWGYLGILVNHLSPQGFAGAYPFVIITTGISILIMGIIVGAVIGYLVKEE